MKLLIFILFRPIELNKPILVNNNISIHYNIFPYSIVYHNKGSIKQFNFEPAVIDVYNVTYPMKLWWLASRQSYIMKDPGISVTASSTMKYHPLSNYDLWQFKFQERPFLHWPIGYEIFRVWNFEVTSSNMFFFIEFLPILYTFGHFCGDEVVYVKID